MFRISKNSSFEQSSNALEWVVVLIVNALYQVIYEIDLKDGCALSRWSFRFKASHSALQMQFIICGTARN